jgi:O-succinylbenzoic acid--CoA ligase
MLVQLLHARVTEWNPSLRLVLLGGAAAKRDILEQCVAQGIPVATTYGLTEAASQVTTALPEDVIRKPDSVGKPLLFTSVQIVDEYGQPVSPGTLGEVCVSGLMVFAGYYGDPAATERALSSGWLNTGDIGYLDDEGDLHIVSRRSDLIVTGGENVYPAEVEGVIRRHIAVKDAAIVGIDDAEWGQRVAAAVVLVDGSRTTEADLIAYCREHLAGYKLPRVIRFVESLPQTTSGKIQRAAVRELFAAT